VKISIQDNPLKPGHKRIVLHTGRRLSFDDFLEHASSSTTLTRTDCLAVLNCAAEWLAIASARGREADLGPLGRSRLGMKGKFSRVPQRLDDADCEMTINWILPGSLKQSAAKAAAGIARQRIEPSDKTPAPIQACRILDNSKPGPHINTYAPGKPLRIYGDRLNYCLTADDEGVFVTDDQGLTRRIEKVVTVQPKQILCIMPDDVHGPLRLDVRRRTKTTASELLSGQLNEPLEEAQ